MSVRRTHPFDPLFAQNVILVKADGERLGMHIKGGLNGQKGNPCDANDEGVFVSKINSSGAARRDGRLKVGMRILEVNGTSLLGATHQEAVNSLRAAGNEIQIVVCKGYDKSSLIHSLAGANAGGGGAMSRSMTGSSSTTTTASAAGSARMGSRTSETGSEMSRSVSSLDRDDEDVSQQSQVSIGEIIVCCGDECIMDLFVPADDNGGVRNRSDGNVAGGITVGASFRSIERCGVDKLQRAGIGWCQGEEHQGEGMFFLPDNMLDMILIRLIRRFVLLVKVLEIVRAAESLALGTHLSDQQQPPKSPSEASSTGGAHHDDKMHKTTTIVMSAHTLDTQPSPSSPQVCTQQN